MQANNKVVKIKSHKNYSHELSENNKKIHKRDRKVKRNLKRNFE